MARKRRLTVDELITQYAALSMKERQRFEKRMLEIPVFHLQWETTTKSDGEWATLDEVATDLEVSRSQVSRYVKTGRLISNGKKNKHFRIHCLSVGIFLTHKTKRIVANAPHGTFANPTKILRLCDMAIAKASQPQQAG